MFITPAQRVNRVNSVRKWDQAFQVYSIIYCEANPGRSSEILQYVDVIHIAASNFLWDNVANYDYMFRKLMASKPWRSCSKTYTQGWNLALKNTQVKDSMQVHKTNLSYGGNSGKSITQHGDQDWCEDYCWKYNKNRCKKSNNECKYNHRCTYCGGWNHGYHNCRKCLKKQS